LLSVQKRSTKESITSFILNQIMKILREFGVTYGSRTRVAAVKEKRPILEMDQSFVLAHAYLCIFYTAKGMYAEAVAEGQELTRLGGDSLQWQIYSGAAYAKAGQRQKAQEILKQLQTTKEYVSPGELPVLYAALGEREQAFASFEKAYAAHDLQLQYLGWDPSFDSLREDPRFKDLMRRVGLTP
jgi:tetratricopeptide (TPR) repeat protein